MGIYGVNNLFWYMDDYRSIYTVFIKKAEVMKKNMDKKGLKRAKAKCPFCDGFWHATLNGHKKHLWLKCDGSCNSMMMS